MSLGYASRLSHRAELGGQLGAREYHDKPHIFEKKMKKLIELFTTHKRIVVFTGAGISTSCGIPDFRGPNGIWTLQRKGKDLPKLKTSFTFAKPSLTHQALKCLVDCGKVLYVVSQNVDGLHLRSGIPREKLAELHGNTFTERCPSCGKEFVRNFEMPSVGFHPTGRRCDVCDGKLKDHVLDWDDALPEDELQLSEQYSSEADLVICLGTSLQIIPACDIPLEAVKTGGKLVIVNLQKTPKDKYAHLIIHEKVDKVMEHLMNYLKLKIPDYIREDRFLVLHQQGIPFRSNGQSLVKVQVIHPQGFKCPLPIIKAVRFRVLNHQSQIIDCDQSPFICKIRCAKGQNVVDISMEFVEHVDLGQTEVHYTFEVYGRDNYLSFQQKAKPLPAALLKSKPNKRMPVMDFKEFCFHTQCLKYGSASVNG